MHFDINSTRLYQSTLPNGIRLIIEKVPSFHSVIIGVVIECGSRSDPPDKSGLAHFVEHMLVRKGNNILRELDVLGITFEAHTEREYTFFYLRLLEDYIPEALSLLFRFLNNKEITEEECAQEKGIIFSEIEFYQERYDEICQQKIIEDMWEGHSLSTPILGVNESVKSITSKDVTDFLRNNYLPENLIISIVGGDISSSAINKLLIEKFRFGKTPLDKIENSLVPVPIRKIGHRQLHITTNSDIIYFTVGINSLNRTHPDRVVLYALSSLLGEGLNSRLMQNLRIKKGYTYDIGSAYQLFAEGGGFYISGISNTEMLPKVIREIETELKLLTDKVPSRFELKMVKNKLKSNFIFNLEDPELRMTRLAKLESWFGRIFPIEEELEMIESVTPKKIKDLSISLLSNGVNLYTIGDSNNAVDLEWTM